MQVIAVLVSLAMLTLTLVARPYKHVEDEVIAGSAQFMLVVVFLGAGYIKAFEDTEAEASREGVTSGFASKIYGFESINFLFGLLLVFSAIMLILLVAILLASSFRMDRTATIRLKDTRKEPELTLKVAFRFL